MAAELSSYMVIGRLSRLTLEQILYGLIVILAMMFRFLSLDKIPLSPAESEEALAVWRLWSPNPNDLTIMSPAYFSLTASITPLIGFSDAIVRIIPALFGLGVVFLPWFLRKYLTRRGTIIATLLIALSPTQNLVSRTVGGDSIAVFAGLLLFIAWLRFRDHGGGNWLPWLGIGLALLFSSAPSAYTVIVSWSLAWLAQRKLGPALMAASPGVAGLASAFDGQQLRRLVKVTIPAFLLLSTSFLLRPDAIGASADMPINWLAQIELDNRLISFFTPLFVIARYELAVLFLAIPAVTWALWDARPLPSFLAYWLIATLLISFLQPGSHTNVVMLTVPAYLLIGHLAGQSLREETGHYKWFLAGILVILSAIVYVNLIRFLRLSQFTELPLFSYNIFLATLAGMGGAVLLSFVWNWHSSLAKQGLLITSLLLVAFYYWGTAWWMTRQGGNDTRERWVTIASDGEIVELAKVIRETSMQITGSGADLEIVSTVPNPALDWYLRDMENVQHYSQLPSVIRSQSIITPYMETPILENSYIGADFGHIRRWTETSLVPRQTLSWWLFHNGPGQIEEERLILWIRGDLSGAPS